MKDTLMSDVINEARRDWLGFLWGLTQCVIVLAVCWGMLVVVFACGGAR
jgi:hypothetical protein